MSRRKIVAGNWKMNGSINANAELLKSIVVHAQVARSVDVVVFPPFPYLSQVQSFCAGSEVKWGAQDVSQYHSGAYTGDVSAKMLLEFGCEYVLVGHSERRALFGDTDRVVAEKFGVVLAAGLIPVLCVGETLAERERGQTEEVIGRQLLAVQQKCGVDAFAKAVIAYEPVWAIGTGKTPTSEQIQGVHAAIRAIVGLECPEIGGSLQILYGGSVKADNAAVFFALSDVDGGLVGGASLGASDFLPIIDCAM